MLSPKKSNLYTKKGDKGFSTLYNGMILNKDSVEFECLGDLDELNSNLGLVKAFWKDEFDSTKLYNAPGAGSMFYKSERCIDTGKYYEWFSLGKSIHEIQCNIMNISTQIATPLKVDYSNDHLDNWIIKAGLNKKIINSIEKYIDRLDSILPPLKNFVVPSGNKLISQIHVCRSITRRCERRYVGLKLDNISYSKDGDPDFIREQLNIPKIYMNRLSDYLFALSRFVAMSLEIEEDLYVRK
jgi:cob(I)alamin adenosyltransferase